MVQNFAFEFKVISSLDEVLSKHQLEECLEYAYFLCEDEPEDSPLAEEYYLLIDELRKLLFYCI